MKKHLVLTLFLFSVLFCKAQFIHTPYADPPGLKNFDERINQLVEDSIPYEPIGVNRKVQIVGDYYLRNVSVSGAWGPAYDMHSSSSAYYILYKGNTVIYFFQKDEYDVSIPDTNPVAKQNMTISPSNYQLKLDSSSSFLSFKNMTISKSYSDIDTLTDTESIYITPIAKPDTLLNTKIDTSSNAVYTTVPIKFSTFNYTIPSPTRSYIKTDRRVLYNNKRQVRKLIKEFEKQYLYKPNIKELICDTVYSWVLSWQDVDSSNSFAFFKLEEDNIYYCDKPGPDADSLSYYTYFKLIQDKNIPSLRKWLRCPNVEMQAYAVRGLFELKNKGYQPTLEDLEMIKAIKNKKGDLLYHSGNKTEYQEKDTKPVKEALEGFTF